MTSAESAFILGVDGGGTGTRCVVTALDGAVLGAGESGPSNYRRVGIETAVEHVRQAAESALRRANLKPPLNVASFCLAGAGLADARPALLTALERLGLARAVALSGDTRAAWAGAHALQPGIVLIAGTGAVAFGVSADGREALADGWGPLWGDEGGAYWIGLRALKAVARAQDGRGPATTLTPALLEHFRVDHPREIISRLPLDRTHSREIAEISRLCDLEAEKGDAPARRILEIAGEHLARASVVVAGALALAPVPRIALMGGVWRSATVRGSLGRCLRGNLPEAQVGDPLLPAVLGAVLLGMETINASPGRDVCETMRDSLRRHPPGADADR